MSRALKEVSAVSIIACRVFIIGALQSLQPTLKSGTRCRWQKTQLSQLKAMILNRDPGWEGKGSKMGLLNETLEMQLRLQYAMAIIRLVNGIADSAQKKKVASSVAALATNAGK